MKRLVGYGAGLLVVVLLMFVPALGIGGGSSDTDVETATITSYDAQFRVDKQGTLHATETVKVSFPVYKHGIFRFFDLKDPIDDRVRFIPKDITVTRDGQSDGVSLSDEDGGRYVVARIGDPDVTISGDHTYVIRYDVPGALSDPQSGAKGSLFYWNLIPGGWRMPIEKSTLTATLPAPPDDVKCAVGVGSSGGCEATVTGNTLKVTTGELRPNTPVTVQAPIALAQPGQKRLPWAQHLDPVLGHSVPLAIFFALLALVALVGGWLLARSVREPAPAYPLMYAPPEGIGPAQGAYLFSERVDDNAYAATMLQLGEKGLATLDHQGDAWTIAGQKGDWGDVDAITGQTAAELGVEAGRSFTARPGDVEGGKKMQTARNGFEGAVKEWARTNGLVEFRWLPRLGALGVVGGGLLALFLFFFNPFNMSLAGLPFGVFAVLALPLLDPRSASFRTKKGRDTWSRIGGFRRVLGTTSSEARFDFSGRKELYLQYVPWAVAFGVADVWAQKYRVEVQEEPPTPGYFVGGYNPMYAGSGGMGSFSDSFNTSVSSAISAYTATQSSSSSGGGGGGFSGGGGGGGGGGGSW